MIRDPAIFSPIALVQWRQLYHLESESYSCGFVKRLLCPSTAIPFDEKQGDFGKFQIINQVLKFGVELNLASICVMRHSLRDISPI